MAANESSITLTCPACGEKDRAVGHLQEMRWHCFACRRDGDIHMDLAPDVHDNPRDEPAPPAGQ